MLRPAPRLSLARRLVLRVARLVPVRPAGLLLAAAAALVVFSWGPKEADFLLYPAALVTLGLVGVTVVVVTLGTLRLLGAVRRLEPGVPERLVTTRLEASGFRVPRLRAAVILDVRVEWLEPRGVTVALEADGAEARELVTPTQRGRGARVVRRFTVEDVFGLARLSFDFAWPAAFQVEPVVARASAELAASRAHGDALANPTGRAEGDLVEMRAYTHGDSMRHVLWKTYARTRRLLVRMPERALAPSPISVAFFVAGDGDEASAGVARLYVESGLLGSDFLFAADGASRPARTVADVVDQLVASAAQRERGALGLPALAQQIDPGRLTACVVFVPAIDGPWRPRLVELLRRLGIQATIILGVDQVPPEERLRGRLERWFLRPPEGVGETRDVTALKQALLAEGFTVHVIHRDTGQAL
jgi:hypothetical protein